MVLRLLKARKENFEELYPRSFKVVSSLSYGFHSLMKLGIFPSYYDVSFMYVYGV